MTEIPEYLLERSRERRAALGLSTGDAPAAESTPATTETSEAAEPAAAAAPAAPAVPEAPPEPEPVAPYVEDAEKRRRMPVWAAPVVLFLPIWAFLYVGTLENPPEEAEGLLGEGETIYAEQCAGCHGATGGGGSGPALAGGEVLLTFPSFTEHFEWVALGTDGYGPAGDVYGDPDRPGGARTIGGGGIMPAFGASISGEELLAVVVYERIEQGAADPALAEVVDEMIETGELELPESFDGMSIEEIDEALAPIVEAAGEAGVGEIALGE